MEKKLFREKCVDRIASPEQLNDYIRVASPGAWLLLGAVAALLIGVCIWGFLGRMETKVPAVAVTRQGQITLYLRQEDVDGVKPGKTATVDGREFPITVVSSQPVQAGAGLSDYAMHIGGFQNGQWVSWAQAEGSLADGVYPAEITVEQVAPMSFILQ